MSDQVDDIIWDLNDKIQELLENSGYMIVGNAYLQENALIQIKKNKEVYDIGIFGNVDKEDINSIKKSELEFDELKKNIKDETRNTVNEVIQDFLFREDFEVICLCAEPDSESKDYGISIGFVKNNMHYSILITDKDFLFKEINI